MDFLQSTQHQKYSIHTGSNTYTPINIWLNIHSKLHLEHQAPGRILGGHVTSLPAKIGRVNLISWFSGMDQGFKHSPQIVHGVEVRTLERSFKSLICLISKQRQIPGSNNSNNCMQVQVIWICHHFGYFWKKTQTVSSTVSQMPSREVLQ